MFMKKSIMAIAAVLLLSGCGNVTDEEIAEDSKQIKPSEKTVAESSSETPDTSDNSDDSIEESDSSKNESESESLDSIDSIDEKDVESSDDSELQKQVNNDVELTDILLIIRENGHGWNNNDEGQFITSNGEVYNFYATDLTPENEHERFIEYENLYPYLLEIMETEKPVTSVKDTEIKEKIAEKIKNNILNFNPSDDEWTSEIAGADIGQKEYKIVRKINGELSFDTIYSSGDEICGYTKNEEAKNIVSAYSDLMIQPLSQGIMPNVSDESKSESDSYADFTEQELEDMETVDKEIEEMQASVEFKNGSLDERAKIAIEKVNDLANRGLITKESIFQMEELISFEYSCGVSGGIMLKGFKEGYN